MNKISKGPAKGAGNAKPKAAPFTADTAAAAGQKSGWMRQKMAEWRKANPTSDASQSERKRMIREILREGTPEALEALRDAMMHAAHKDRVTAAKAWIEQDIGRPAQAVELGGADGAPLKIEIVRFGADTE